MRGTPHVHSLVAVRKDGIVAGDLTSSHEEDRKAVGDLVSNVVTCCLQHCAVDDLERLDYLWRPMKPAAESAEDYEHDVRRFFEYNGLSIRREQRIYRSDYEVAILPIPMCKPDAHMYGHVLEILI